MNHVFDLSIEIVEYEFSRAGLKNISENNWVKNQWPLVYFIKNMEIKKAYVGESTNALSRLNDHLNNEERSILNQVSIIGCDKFNKSATLDIESNLIQYISSEGTFSLQNGNNGLSHHNYYQRDLYKDLFKEVWKKLIDKKVVFKSLEEIQNSDFFKYSPYKSLSQDQYNSVLEIIENLNEKSSSHIFVKGSAGTGKTVLATYLIKLLTSNYDDLNIEEINDENSREIQLLYDFHKKFPNFRIGLVIAMTSLRTTLQNVFSKIPGLRREMVISPADTFKEKYDILIVDEAHRLRQRKNISWMGVFTQRNRQLGFGNEGTELDWILANSSHQIFFYDSAQSVKPSDVSKENFDLILSNATTVELELKSQMRVNAGSDYISFVDNLLNCRLGEVDNHFIPKDYELRVFESFTELHGELKNKERQYKLCRLIAGYSWPWETQEKNSQKDYDIEIEGLRFSWNRTDKDWINSTNAFEEIGCIHTTQGYDLNYVGVIFGGEIRFNPESQKIEIEPANYFDRFGKAGISDLEVLKEYIINIYKTIMYRGIKGTFIYACDRHLSAYLRKSIYSSKNIKPFRILNEFERRPYLNCVPLYDISVAAGSFSEPHQLENTEWVELPKPFKANKDLFVCKIMGESMNKKIGNGSWCLFRKDLGGSREGQIVLVQHYNIHDSDFGAGYTLKSYHSEKVITEDGWLHTKIVLGPLSNDPSFSEIELNHDEVSALMVIGIFVCELK